MTFFAPSERFFRVSEFKKFSGFLSIFSIAFTTGAVTNAVKPKPTALDAKDFAHAYCLSFLCNTVGDAAAEGLVATADVLCEQTHGEDLEKEELSGEVDEAEEKQPEGTEIEREQAVPEHQRQR